jgi:NADPH-dependent 2,4-dienoyl-CoA reductase/sulfur reductase-like enzyme
VCVSICLVDGVEMAAALTTRGMRVVLVNGYDAFMAAVTDLAKVW